MTIGSDDDGGTAGPTDRPGIEIDLRPRRDEMPAPVRAPGDDRFRDLQADRQALIAQLTRALERAQTAEARLDDCRSLLRQCRERLSSSPQPADEALLARIDAALATGTAARD